MFTMTIKKDLFLEYVEINQYLQDVWKLGKSQSIALAQKSFLKNYQTGDKIFSDKKTYQDTVYIIFSGNVLLQTVLIDGSYTCQLFTKEDYFPLDLKKTTRYFEIHQAVACQETRILHVPLTKLNELLELQPQILTFFYQCLIRKQTEMLENENNYLSGKRRHRIGALLWNFAQSCGQTLETGDILLPEMLTRAVIGAFTQTGHSWVDNIIRDFRDEGLLFKETPRLILNEKTLTIWSTL